MEIRLTLQESELSTLAVLNGGNPPTAEKAAALLHQMVQTHERAETHTWHERLQKAIRFIQTYCKLEGACDECELKVWCRTNQEHFCLPEYWESIMEEENNA